MYTSVVCIFLLFAVAFAQMNVGDAWQGTWSSGKRSGGQTFICVDPFTSTAHGTYSGIGLFSGFLQGNTLTGFWWEAGYDRPFGPFELTLSGSSFSGTWSYYEGDGVAPSGSFSWTGSRSSPNRPAANQCLAPATGSNAAGIYEPGNYLCYHPNLPYGNTNQESASARFPRFGDVNGYSPDNGISFLLSNFYFPNITGDDLYRPENNEAVFGPCTNCNRNNKGKRFIPTTRVVIGRLVSNAEFCGFFWEGLYNRQVGEGAICLQRTTKVNPDPLFCGSDTSYNIGLIDRLVSDGATSFILNQVQNALDNFPFPPIIVRGPIPDDDDFNPFPPGPNPPLPPGVSASPRPSGVLPDDDDFITNPRSSSSVLGLSLIFLAALLFAL